MPSFINPESFTAPKPRKPKHSSRKTMSSTRNLRPRPASASPALSNAPATTTCVKAQPTKSFRPIEVSDDEAGSVVAENGKTEDVDKASARQTFSRNISNKTFSPLQMMTKNLPSTRLNLTTTKTMQTQLGPAPLNSVLDGLLLSEQKENLSYTSSSNDDLSGSETSSLSSVSEEDIVNDNRASGDERVITYDDFESDGEMTVHGSGGSTPPHPPTPGPSSRPSRFVAGSRHTIPSPKRNRDMQPSWSDSDNDSTTSQPHARKTVKKSKVDVGGCAKITKPAFGESLEKDDDLHKKPSAPSSLSLSDLFVQADWKFQGPHENIINLRQSAAQIAAWKTIKGHKLHVLISGPEKEDMADIIIDTVSCFLESNSDHLQVGSAVREARSWILSGLRGHESDSLAQIAGLGSPGAFMRFIPFNEGVPSYIGTLVKFEANRASPERLLKVVHKAVAAMIKDDTRLQSIVTDHRELAGGMSPAAITKIMAKTLRVFRIEIGTPGGGTEIGFSIYCEQPSAKPEYYELIRRHFTNPGHFTVTTIYNGHGIFLPHLFSCGICFSVDHFTSRCDLPHHVGWNGPTAFSLDEARKARNAAKAGIAGQDSGERKEKRNDRDDKKSKGSRPKGKGHAA
ncbi:hypothetical protein C8J56DRAFT_905625 [Mycena floridula]|nr:hypothetical protein C8J56DRAFT_905625 [Mycena floridula]